MSLRAFASATLSVVSPSLRCNSSGRPKRPPSALMSSITIVATLAFAMPMTERGRVWSAMTPTLIGRREGADSFIGPLLGRCSERGWLQRGSACSERRASGRVAPAEFGSLRLPDVSGLLHDCRHPVSYTHLRAHETGRISYAVFCL